nr:hypothetical protein [Kibdelosporangium sp. MJ126-NF4]CEL22692.1 hypothetical protein [Kibdelosporangium sp. MJ126-NF4]CTQ89832.1 hypothetical protein [Kibdelosporangium sp. MJ126-NF4]
MTRHTEPHFGQPDSAMTTPTTDFDLIRRQSVSRADSVGRMSL